MGYHNYNPIRCNYWAIISQSNSNPRIVHIGTVNAKTTEELLNFLWKKHPQLNPEEDTIMLCGEPKQFGML